MAKAGKKDFSRFDDLHRLRTSCKDFRVCRAESSDENSGRCIRVEVIPRRSNPAYIADFI